MKKVEVIKFPKKSTEFVVVGKRDQTCIFMPVNDRTKDFIEKCRRYGMEVRDPAEKVSR
jgi:hypothetical protein